MSGWSALLGALGLVALGFSLLSLLVLLVAGGREADLLWVWGNLGVGVVLLAAALLSGLDDLRERMGSGEARRVGKYGTSAVASTLLGIAIVGLLSYLGTQNSVRFDWSEAGIHSLADQTQKVLAGLERDVQVVAFYPPVEMARVRPLLEKYEYASERFQVTYADPTARPDLVEQHGIAREQLSGGVIHVTLGDQSTLVDESTEQRLTNALVKLTRTADRKVYFATGHNERPALGEGAGGEGGFGRAADALRNENYRIDDLVLAARGEVPEDADALVLAGPTRPFLPEEHAALEAYLRRGGGLLVLLDPMAQTDLYDDLEAWGAEVGDDFVIDQVQGLFGRPASPLAAQYGDHPITRDLREVTLFHLVRSVRPRDGEDGLQPIVYTSESSWAETNLEAQPERDADDVEGPVPIAVAGTLSGGSASSDAGEDGQDDATPSGRLVIVGDSDFASNELIGAYRNRDLFVNAVNWLLGDVEAISVRPNRSRASRLQLSEEQFDRIRTLSLFALPEALAVLGAVAWWVRRRAPGR